MKKIGIIIDSTECSSILYSTIKELEKIDQAEYYYIVNGGTQTSRSKHNRCSGQPLRNVFFKIIIFFEHRILSLLSHNLKEYCQTRSINEFIAGNSLCLSPVYSASDLTLSDDEGEINKIKTLDLDLIINGTANENLDRSISELARDGVISIVYSPKYREKNGPPAFREVLMRESSTGFAFVLSSERQNYGSILIRGELTTARSYTENLVRLKCESHPYLIKIISDYTESGRLSLGGDVLPLDQVPPTAPSFLDSVRYSVKTLSFYSGFLISRKVLKKYERWNVAFLPGPWQDADLRSGFIIKNPRERFFADPFVITRNGKTICYVEDFILREKKGCISAIEILDDKNYNILGPVIKEPFHMSFPFLMEYEGELYMIPETSEAESVRLYKCIDFPLGWEYQKDIMTDLSTVDTIIFRHDRHWWLLTNTAIKKNNDYDSRLFAYYSDHPFSGEWTAHDMNPLVFSNKYGRNGGMLTEGAKLPIRVRQNTDYYQYGSSMTLARITELSKSTFSEHEIRKIKPDFFKKIRGCHHMHSDGNYTVYDFIRLEVMK